MKDTVTLFCVDGQNGFCHKSGSLYVPGADQDIQNTVRIINELNPDNLILSGDMHPANHISFNTQWVDKNNDTVPVFTPITRFDVLNGDYAHVEGKKSRSYILDYLGHIEFNNKTHVVFPPHCIAGSWESCFEDRLRSAVSDWEVRNGKEATYYFKGQHAAIEQFSIVNAEATIKTNSIPNKDLDWNINKQFITSTVVLFTLEAGSHCTGQTVSDFVMRYHYMLGANAYNPVECIWVEDAISPVTGCDAQQQKYINELVSNGGKVYDTNYVLNMKLDRRPKRSSVERAKLKI